MRNIIWEKIKELGEAIVGWLIVGALVFGLWWFFLRDGSDSNNPVSYDDDYYHGYGSREDEVQDEYRAKQAIERQELEDKIYELENENQDLEYRIDELKYENY